MIEKNCASCIDFSVDKIIESKKELEPTWLSKTNYVENFITKQKNKRIKVPENYDVILKINLGYEHKNKKVLYWASEKQKYIQKVKNAKEAYGKFLNNGVANVSKSGELILKFRCPEIYRAQVTKKSLPKSFFKHVHFVFFDESKNEWGKQIYTKIVTCKYNLSETIKKINSGYCVLINTLPCEYFAKDHIPNSYNLYYKNIDKISKQNLLEWFQEIIKLHYPKLDKLVNEKKMELYEIPIITYCYNKQCNASEMAIESLMKKGFVNIDEYEGGIQDFRQNIPVDKIIKINKRTKKNKIQSI